MGKYYYAGDVSLGLCQNRVFNFIYSAIVVKKIPVVLFWLLLLAATNSSALSLGRHRGAALIGRPLDISVQAVLDVQEDPAGLCLDADVFYGDNKLGKSRVRVSAEKISPAGPDAVIHIRSSALIDEPVVTFYLRVGCQQKTEKRYVVLADMASEAALGALPTITPQAARIASVTSAGAVAGQLAKAPTASGASRRTRSGVTSRDTAASPGAADTTAFTIPPADAPAATLLRLSKKIEKDSRASAKGGARLKLEPLDLTSERNPQLKSSGEILSAPLSTQERSAAAALWRALTAQPQDILRDAEKLQSLEATVRSLQVQAQKNRLAVDSLNGQVKQAKSERYANELVYILGTLLLIALAALVYLLPRTLWSRNKNADEIPWWRKSESREKGWSDDVGRAGVSSLPGSVGAKKANQKEEKKSIIPVLDLDLAMSGEESRATEVQRISALAAGDSIPSLPGGERSDFPMSMSHPSRGVKAEELFDVQQQAEFFVTLGQHEQAIEVLRSHIDESGETSALVYLDLFNLYHQLKRRDDYEVLREDFNRRFNGKILAFDFYNEISHGLEAYQSALTRIEALWPSSKVLDIIEESLFRTPDAGAEAFDLEAYRELLLLYSVAKEIIHPDMDTRMEAPKFDLPAISHDDNVRNSKFSSTLIQPLSASVVDDKSEEKYEPLLASVRPPASLNVGLDLDLNELEADDTSQSPVSLPGAAAKSVNLIDFDLLASSKLDDGKTEPSKPPQA